MIYQLQDGRIIEISVEEYLSMTDDEINELNGNYSLYAIECDNPFYNLYSESKEEKEEEILELPDIDPEEKLKDDYYYSNEDE